MKKIIALMLALILTLAMFGCDQIFAEETKKTEETKETEPYKDVEVTSGDQTIKPMPFFVWTKVYENGNTMYGDGLGFYPEQEKAENNQENYPRIVLDGKITATTDPRFSSISQSVTVYTMDFEYIEGEFTFDTLPQLEDGEYIISFFEKNYSHRGDASIKNYSVNGYDHVFRLVVGDIPDETKPSETDKGVVEIDIAALDQFAVRGGAAVFYTSALNKELLDKKDKEHLPIIKVESFEEFNQIFSGYNGDADETPFPTDLNEEYFSRFSLLLVQQRATSGSYRYGVKDIYIDATSVCVYVEQTNDPYVFTDDEMSWLIGLFVEKSIIEGVTSFDAVFE